MAPGDARLLPWRGDVDAAAPPPPPPPAECVYAKSWLPPARPASASSASASAAAAQPQAQAQAPQQARAQHPLAGAPAVSTASDNAKLVFGTVFSLRNMVRKLGGDDDAFISYRTGQYKLHFYETPANLRLVLLTDTASAGMRNVLHQIYINLWVEYGASRPSLTPSRAGARPRGARLTWPPWPASVVKNPLAPVEHKGGDGVKNELFELGLDQFIRGLM